MVTEVNSSSNPETKFYLSLLTLHYFKFLILLVEIQLKKKQKQTLCFGIFHEDIKFTHYSQNAHTVNRAKCSLTKQLYLFQSFLERQLFQWLKKIQMPGCIGTTFCGGSNYPRGKKEKAIPVPSVSEAKQLLVGDEDRIQKFYLNTEILG